MMILRTIAALIALLNLPIIHQGNKHTHTLAVLEQVKMQAGENSQLESTSPNMQYNPVF